MLRYLTVPLLAALAACAPVATKGPGVASAPAPAPLAAAPGREARERIVLLVGIDGGRPDYLTRDWAPNLTRLAEGGVRAAMRPSFPTKTFPNFWTIATGVRPDRSGIVANAMEDPALPSERFTMATDDPVWWNAARPIWVAAEDAGIRSATMFWPGANVAWGATPPAAGGRRWIGGRRASDWAQFNQAISAEQRVETVLDWMRRPAPIRPRFVTLYFDDVDTAGHDRGPGDPAVRDAMRRVDAAIGRLVATLATLDQPVDLVIVADHGMAATSSDRVVALDTILPAADYRLVESGPYATLAPAPGREAEVAARLSGALPHMRCWPKGSLPARFGYGTSTRIPPWLCLADTGWLIEAQAPERSFRRGTHGYDPAAPEMQAMFVASGPSFRAGATLPGFANTAVHPLLRRLLGLPADPGLDGTLTPLAGALRKPD